MHGREVARGEPSGKDKSKTRESRQRERAKARTESIRVAPRQGKGQRERQQGVCVRVYKDSNAKVVGTKMCSSSKV